MENSEHAFRKIVEKALEAVREPGYAPNILSPIFSNINKVFFEYLHDRPKGSGLYYGFLQEVTAQCGAGALFVELGNREGISSLMFCSKLKNNQKFVSVDQEKNLKFVPPEVRVAKNVKFLFGNDISPEILSNFKENSIDVLFIDTLHRTEHLNAEMKLYEPFLKNEALILLDDADMKEMRLGWNKIGHEKENHPDLHGTGFGIIFFSRKPA